MTKSALPFLLALIVILSSVGCATKHALDKKIGSADITSQNFTEYLKQLDNEALYRVALDFYNKRDYDAYMKCAEEFLPRSTQENWKPIILYKYAISPSSKEKIFYIDSPNYQATWAEVTARILVKRSVLFLELGNLAAAKEDAEKAVTVLEMDTVFDSASEDLAKSGLLEMQATVAQEQEKEKPIFWGRSDFWVFHYAEAKHAYGLVIARLGQKEAATRVIKEIDALSVFFGAPILDKIKKATSMQIYLAAGDFESAKQETTRYTGITLSECLLGAFSIATGAIGIFAGNLDLIIQSVWGISNIAQARSTDVLLNNFCLSKIAFETGDVNSARMGYEALLKNKSLTQISGLHWVILHDRGRIAEKDGQLEDAIGFYQRSIDVIEAHRATINLEASKIGFVGDKQIVYLSLVRLLIGKGSFEAAFNYAERSKARSLIDLLASQKAFNGGNRKNGQKSTALLAEMDKIERDSAVKAMEIPSDGPSSQRSLKVLQQGLQESDPELLSLVKVTPPDVKELQQLLCADETLIEYYGGRNELFAFLVSKENIVGYKLETDNIKWQIVAFRKDIASPPDISRNKGDGPALTENDAQLFQTSQSLYDQLMRPLEKKVTTKNLTIVPHGPLHYLPFGALHNGKQYLIDQYRINLLPSASVMKYINERRKNNNGGLLVFGNPDLKNPGYDLPGAEMESIAIAQQASNAALFTRSDATETAAKNFSGQYQYIHFAMHSVFDADAPLASGLLMAADNQNDGILTVGELYDMSLSADLVTLSACETALGKVSNGDELIGFTRGFLYAGANSIVSSLWKVDDASTSILMQRFYQQLGKTDKISALRDSQLYIKSTHQAHPFYWAAFQLIGFPE